MATLNDKANNTKKRKINWAQLIRDIILAILSAITATEKLLN